MGELVQMNLFGIGKKFGPGISFFESVWHAYSESCSSALLLLGHWLVLSIYFQSHVQVLSICSNV